MTLLGRTVVEPDADALPVRIEVRGGRIAAVTPAPETAGQALPFVFPGFIDAHTHPVETGLQLLFVDLKAAVSVRDALDLLRERLETGRECGVMLGFNLEPERLAEQRFPTRNELDRLAGGLPTLVYRVDGHSAALNSAGLELLAHPWPGGVEMLADRTPSGTVRGPAYERLSQTFKRRLPPEGIRTALVLASDLGLRAGVTTMAAFVGGPELAAREWRELVDALAGLTIRAVPVLQTWDAAVAHGFGLPRVGGCLLLDGSFGSRTAALSRSYADAAGSGALYRTDAEVEGLVREASALGLQTAFHAIGDLAVEQAVRCHERAGSAGAGLRHRIEHAELLSPALIERIRRLGIVLCVQPAFEAAWGGPEGMYASRLGERWRSTNPLRALVAAGMHPAGGSDSPITPVDPLAGIRAALALPNAEQRLDPPSAVAMFTTWAAESLGLERQAGSIRPGLDADLALLTGDPRNRSDVQVVATIRRGRRVYQNSELAAHLPCQDS